MTIEVTDEMLTAALDQLCSNGAGCAACVVDALAAVLAIVERDRSDEIGLTRAANAARRVAVRYGEKGKDRSGADWQMWTAMSAGARAVAVRLTELADEEGATS